MDTRSIILFGLLLCLFLIIKKKITESAESFTNCKSESCKSQNNSSVDGYIEHKDYQPATPLKDDVTINIPKHSCDNTLHHDLFCKFCYYDENGKWKCDQCTKHKKKKNDKFQSRYLRAMEAMKKISAAFDAGQITQYTYHLLFTKWLKIYYDVTLLPKDKVDQLFCASYLSVIDSSKDKTKFEDFIYNTWPSKCSTKIPSILYGEIDNIEDVSANNKIDLEKPDGLDDIENTLNEIKDGEEKMNKKLITDIGDFRKDWESLWDR